LFALKLKSILKSIVAKIGYEIRRRPVAQAAAVTVGSRDTLLGGLQHVKSLGWIPHTVIDVGAAHGSFTQAAFGVFPEAHYLLVEPLVEYQTSLDRVLTQVPNSALAQTAAGSMSGSATFHVHVDHVGSSLYHETEGPLVDGVPRAVPITTLDNLHQEMNLTGPFLVKVDVQGAELEVLTGAKEVLKQTDYVILEVSLFQFFVGGPQLHDITAFMKEAGFVAYDTLGCIYRLFDGALSQVDIAFVKEQGVFRQTHLYASPEQRAAQDALFVSQMRVEPSQAASTTPAQ
jgi:FkbM family methyltransferase